LNPTYVNFKATKYKAENKQLKEDIKLMKTKNEEAVSPSADAVPNNAERVRSSSLNKYAAANALGLG
jgi:hypothetical protein